MKKSWIAFLLPKDEYKETRILYFIAESFFLLIGIVLLIIFSNRFSKVLDEEIPLVLLAVLISLIGYVLIRYIFSGIEYANVFEEVDYRRELKKMFLSGFRFAIIFAFISSVLKLLEIINFDWTDIFGITFITFILVIIMNYISLRSSFKKNIKS
jgi:hypothetical protein